MKNQTSKTAAATTATTCTWYRTELEAIVSLQNSSIKAVIQENPIESVFDWDDPDYADMRIYRLSFKTSVS